MLGFLYSVKSSITKEQLIPEYVSVCIPLSASLLSVLLSRNREEYLVLTSVINSVSIMLSKEYILLKQTIRQLKPKKKKRLFPLLLSSPRVLLSTVSFRCRYHRDHRPAGLGLGDRPEPLP